MHEKLEAFRSGLLRVRLTGVPLALVLSVPLWVGIGLVFDLVW